MSRLTAKVSPKSLKEDDQDSDMKAGRSPYENHTDNQKEADRCLIFFLLRTDSKALERQEIKGR